MGYKEIFQESNDEAAERYDLVLERITEIAKEQQTAEKYQDYFKKTADFICLTAQILQEENAGMLKDRSLSTCEEENLSLIHI